MCSTCERRCRQKQIADSPVVNDRQCEKVIKATFMDPVLGRFRSRLRRKFAIVLDKFRELMAAGQSTSQGFASQRMCPFCGLITPRSKPACLECGKSPSSLPLEPKPAK